MKTLTNLSREQKSMSGEEIRNERKVEASVFSKFVGKKIQIKCKSSNDLFSERNTKLGRIMEKDKQYIFVPKGNRTRAFNLTLGAFDGWFATLTVDEISLGWN